MPKTIKKKAAKKTNPEHDIKSFYDKAILYFDENKKNIITFSGIVLIIAALIIGVTLYKHYAFQKAEQLSGEAYKLYHNLFTVDSKKGDNERIEAALEKLTESYEYKQSSQTLFYISSCYYELGKTAEAEASLLKLIDQFPSENEMVPLAYLKLFRIFKKLGEKDKAVNYIKELTELDTDFYRDLALIEWAEMLVKDGDADKAIEKYNELIVRFPDSTFKEEASSRIKTIGDLNKEDQKGESDITTSEKEEDVGPAPSGEDEKTKVE